MRKSSARLRLIVVVWLSLFMSACALPNLQRAQPTAAIPIDLPMETQAQLRDFDLAVKAVRDQYIDAKAAGAEWQSTVNTYRAQVSKGMESARFFDTLDELLATLRDDDLALARPVAQPAPDATPAVTATFSGIGIVPGMPEADKDRIVVFAVVADSPAESAGVKAHDAIVAIDGRPVTFAERDTLLSRLRGQNGAKVTLTIRSPGKGARDLTLTRQPISPASTLVFRRIPDTNIGYIRPDILNVEVMRLAISLALRDLSDVQSLDGLVLDLRVMQSPAFPITEMLGLFVNGQVGNLYTRAGKTKIEITGKNIAGSQELPLVVLAGDQTRGLAESFAGILQDLGRARIVGAPTPGRLALQAVLALPNSGAQLAIPSGEYRGVKDKSWFRQGIMPDIHSELAWEDYTDEDDPQIKQAVQALTR